MNSSLTTVRHSLSAKKGVVLIFTFIIMITLTVITVAFLHMTSTQLRSSAYDVQSSKALWLAEAGIQKYMYYLKDGTYDNDNHPGITESLGDGNYSLAAPLYDPDTFTYPFVSTGTVGSVQRQITQSVVATPGGVARAIHADGAHVKFEGSTGGTVNGNISCFVSVQSADDLANYQDFVDGTYTITDGQEQDKINPSISLSTYLTFANEDDNPPGDVHVDTNLTFNAGTYDGVYYATKTATINDGAVINGSVICEKTLSFANGPITVAIRPEQSTRAQANGQNYVALYAGSSISSTGSGAPSGRRGLQNSTINGLVLAGTDLAFNYLDNTTFTGTIVAGNNINFLDSSNANGLSFVINYNVNIFTPMIVGFSFSGGAVISPQNDWNEIVPVA